MLLETPISIMNNNNYSKQFKSAESFDYSKEYKKAWDIFDDLYNKGCRKDELTTYMAKYLIHGFHVKSDIKRAYEICNEENVDILRLRIAERCHQEKKYEEAWIIFSEIDTCKFRLSNYSSKSNNIDNIAKFTAKFWMNIYIFEGYYKKSINKIDENFKDLYLLIKAMAFHHSMKYLEEWNILNKLSKSKTTYSYDAKYWMARYLLHGLGGVKKDEERAYNFLKEVYNHLNITTLQDQEDHYDYFKRTLEDRRLCIDFDFDFKPRLSTIAIFNQNWLKTYRL